MVRAFFSDAVGREAAYSLLAYAFRSVYGEPLPKIEKNASGKPFFPRRLDVHFSVSHGKRHSLVILGDVPCGCDAEHERPVRRETVARVTSEEELRSLSFIELWTLKEAYIKLIGGLKGSMRDIRFSLEDGKINTPEEDVSARIFKDGDAYLTLMCRGGEPSAPIFVSAAHLGS